MRGATRMETGSFPRPVLTIAKPHASGEHRLERSASFAASAIPPLGRAHGRRCCPDSAAGPSRDATTVRSASWDLESGTAHPDLGPAFRNRVRSVGVSHRRQPAPSPGGNDKTLRILNVANQAAKSNGSSGISEPDLVSAAFSTRRPYPRRRWRREWSRLPGRDAMTSDPVTRLNWSFRAPASLGCRHHLRTAGR